ncbi:kinesin-like protein KIF9 [Lycodopsis pacificus]
MIHLKTVNIHHRKDSRKPQDTRKNQLSNRSFRLEGILQGVSQEELYARVCRQVVLGALDGYNGTVMCFGQTGAGKTYTMTGSTESYQQRGVIPRALQEVFREVDKRTEHFFSVHLSYLEIYNETLVDLLSSLQGSPRPSPHGMVVMEEPGRGVFIRGLSLHPVHSEEEAFNLLFEGELNHIIGSHALNRNSSRSHSIFTVHIESRLRTLSDAKYVTSKLNLVDLAGSERLGKTGSEGQMFKEAMYINKSLSFLEQAIRALADRRRDHVPFRQTKLTHALKGSLGGNCNTVLVANIYGEAAHIEETLSTLRFASRMKCVRTNPAVNEHRDPAAQIKKLEKDVQMLKEELSMYNILAKRPSITYEPLSEAQLAEIHSQVQRYLEGNLQEISIVSIRQVQAVFAQFKLAVQKQGQKVKPQRCQTYDLVEKDQSANTAAFEEMDSRGSTEASNQSLRNERQSSTKTITKKSKDKSLPSLPSSTPCKAEAFEGFKVGPGSKINRILKENKAVLLERRSLLRQLTEEVNAVKREIDCTTASIQQQETRGGQGQYLVLEEEPDATSLMKLRELKGRYRQRYEVLRDIKADVNYCQHLVDQCRVHLLSEFENWYEKSFPVPEEEITKDKTLEQGEDNQRPCELPPDDCSSESFHNARYRMLTRASLYSG